MRSVFFGTPQWAVDSLEALVSEGIEVVFAVTNPDRPAGRGMALQPSPVKRAAEAHGIQVVQPERASEAGLAQRLEEARADVAVVVAYGKLLPSSLLTVPAHGFVNLHFSLLPAYRGAAPVQHSLIDGLEETGVSVIQLTAGMDEGPVLATRIEPIHADDSTATLGARLARVGAPLLAETVVDLVAGRAVPYEQDHDVATYAPKIGSGQAQIDWLRSSREISGLVRGLDPEPAAWTLLQGKRLRVFRVRKADDAGRLEPGEVSVHKGVYTGTGDGTVELEDVQLEGKRRMSGRELANGLRVAPGTRFG